MAGWAFGCSPGRRRRRVADPAPWDGASHGVGRPRFDGGQLFGAHLYVGSGPRSAVRILAADGAAVGVMQPRGGDAVVAGDVDDVAVGVGGEPSEVAGVVVPELTRVWMLIACSVKQLLVGGLAGGRLWRVERHGWVEHKSLEMLHQIPGADCRLRSMISGKAPHTSK